MVKQIRPLVMTLFHKRTTVNSCIIVQAGFLFGLHLNNTFIEVFMDHLQQ